MFRTFFRIEFWGTGSLFPAPITCRRRGISTCTFIEISPRFVRVRRGNRHRVRRIHTSGNWILRTWMGFTPIQRYLPRGFLRQIGGHCLPARWLVYLMPSLLFQWLPSFRQLSFPRRRQFPGFSFLSGKDQWFGHFPINGQRRISRSRALGQILLLHLATDTITRHFEGLRLEFQHNPRLINVQDRGRATPSRVAFFLGGPCKIILRPPP